MAHRLSSPDPFIGVGPPIGVIRWKAALKPKIHQRIDGNILTKHGQLRVATPDLTRGQAWQSDQAGHELDELQELVSCAMTKLANIFLHLTR